MLLLGGGERLILAVTKNNLASTAPALAFRLEETEPGLLRVAWDGQTDYTARSLLREPKEDEGDGAMGKARRFLLEELADGPRVAGQLIEAAEAEGINARTLQRARKDLGVGSAKAGFGKDGNWS